MCCVKLPCISSAAQAKNGTIIVVTVPSGLIPYDSVIAVRNEVVMPRA